MGISAKGENLRRRLAKPNLNLPLVTAHLRGVEIHPASGQLPEGHLDMRQGSQSVGVSVLSCASPKTFCKRGTLASSLREDSFERS